MGKAGKRRLKATASSAGQRRRRKKGKVDAKRKTQTTHMVKPFWNEKKTLRANFSELGIVFDVNSDLKRKVKIQANENPQLLHEAIQAKLERPVKKRKIKSMEYEEQRRLRKLIEKHGENYLAMSRDYKINTYQKTPKQLEKRITLLKRLQAEGLDHWGDIHSNPIPDHYDTSVEKFRQHTERYKNNNRQVRRRKRLKEKKEQMRMQRMRPQLPPQKMETEQEEGNIEDLKEAETSNTSDSKSKETHEDSKDEKINSEDKVKYLSDDDI